jgi:release factor glutamine methyltransferase
LASASSAVGPSDARFIVEEASGYDRASFIVHAASLVPARAMAYLDAMVARRAAGEPLQYVLGRWGFRSLDLMVDRRVLIPRPETEEVVGWAMALVAGRRRLRAADLGTGSGAIALSLASELGASVWATDISAPALDVASANLAGLGGWAATRVQLCLGCWWDALPSSLRGSLDLIVSNPPYVGEHDPLPPSVADYEPPIALRAGPLGMDALDVIVRGAPEWLAPGGALVVEIDPRQASVVSPLAASCGLSASIRADSSGRDRALVATWT